MKSSVYKSVFTGAALCLGLILSVQAHADFRTIVECVGPRIENDDGDGYKDIKYTFTINALPSGIHSAALGGVDTGTFESAQNIKAVTEFLNDSTNEYLSIQETGQELGGVSNLYINRLSKKLKAKTGWDSDPGRNGYFFRVIEIVGENGYVFDSDLDFGVSKVEPFGKLIKMRKCKWKL